MQTDLPDPLGSQLLSAFECPKPQAWGEEWSSVLTTRSQRPEGTGGKDPAGLSKSHLQLGQDTPASAQNTRVQLPCEPAGGTVNRRALQWKHRGWAASDWIPRTTRSPEVEPRRMKNKQQKREMVLKTHSQELVSD